MAISRRRVEILVGFFVLAGIVTLLISVVFIGKRQQFFEDRVRVTTTFRSVEGLQVGAPVYIAGIEAGSVDAVTFTPAGEVLVRLEIRAGLFDRIREDSRARLKTTGLVGDRYVDLTVGSQDSPALGEDGAIPGIDPVDVTQVLAEARPVLDNLTVAIENMRQVTDRLLSAKSDINVTLSNMRAITDGLREGRGTVGRLLTEDDVYEDLRATAASARETTANAAALTATLRDGAPDLMTDSQAAVKEVRRAAEGATEVMEGTDALVVQAREHLPGVLAGLERSMAELERVLTNLRDASADLKAATPQLPSIVAEGQAAVDEGRAVIRAARMHPLLRRYVQAEAAEADVPILVRDRGSVTDAP